MFTNENFEHVSDFPRKYPINKQLKFNIPSDGINTFRPNELVMRFFCFEPKWRHETAINRMNRFRFLRKEICRFDTGATAVSGKKSRSSNVVSSVL